MITRRFEVATPLAATLSKPSPPPLPGKPLPAPALSAHRFKSGKAAATAALALLLDAGTLAAVASSPELGHLVLIPSSGGDGAAAPTPGASAGAGRGAPPPLHAAVAGAEVLDTQPLSDAAASFLTVQAAHAQLMLRGYTPVGQWLLRPCGPRAAGAAPRFAAVRLSLEPQGKPGPTPATLTVEFKVVRLTPHDVLAELPAFALALPNLAPVAVMGRPTAAAVAPLAQPRLASAFSLPSDDPLSTAETVSVLDLHALGTRQALVGDVEAAAGASSRSARLGADNDTLPLGGLVASVTSLAHATRVYADKEVGVALRALSEATAVVSGVSYKLLVLAGSTGSSSSSSSGGAGGAAAPGPPDSDNDNFDLDDDDDDGSGPANDGLSLQPPAALSPPAAATTVAAAAPAPRPAPAASGFLSGKALLAQVSDASSGAVGAAPAAAAALPPVPKRMGAAAKWAALAAGGDLAAKRKAFKGLAPTINATETAVSSSASAAAASARALLPPTAAPELAAVLAAGGYDCGATEGSSSSVSSLQWSPMQAWLLGSMLPPTNAAVTVLIRPPPALASARGPLAARLWDLAETLNAVAPIPLSYVPLPPVAAAAAVMEPLRAAVAAASGDASGAEEDDSGGGGGGGGGYLSPAALEAALTPWVPPSHQSRRSTARTGAAAAAASDIWVPPFKTPPPLVVRPDDARDVAAAATLARAAAERVDLLTGCAILDIDRSLLGGVKDGVDGSAGVGVGYEDGGGGGGLVDGDGGGGEGGEGGGEGGKSSKRDGAEDDDNAAPDVKVVKKRGGGVGAAAKASKAVPKKAAAAAAGATGTGDSVGAGAAAAAADDDSVLADAARAALLRDGAAAKTDVKSLKALLKALKAPVSGTRPQLMERALTKLGVSGGTGGPTTAAVMAAVPAPAGALPPPVPPAAAREEVAPAAKRPRLEAAAPAPAPAPAAPPSDDSSDLSLSDGSDW